MAHIIIYGNLNEGFEFVGPFEDFDAAHEYEERHRNDCEWWISTLTAPEEN